MKKIVRCGGRSSKLGTEEVARESFVVAQICMTRVSGALGNLLPGLQMMSEQYHFED